MTTDLATIDQLPAAFSVQSLTPNTQSVLARAYDRRDEFTAADIALIEPVASAVAVPQPASAQTIRQSIGALSAALPAQDVGAAGSKLRLNAYMTMLEGCDERALANACRRCLAELDWMPTIKQLRDRLDQWISPENEAIGRAKAILSFGRRAIEGDGGDPVDLAEVTALRERLATTMAIGSRRVEAVGYSDPAPLEAHQLKIPNKDDYQRLFGIDPGTERLRAEAQQRAAEEADQDLLADAVALHNDLWSAVPVTPPPVTMKEAA